MRPALVLILLTSLTSCILPAAEWVAIGAIAGATGAALTLDDDLLRAIEAQPQAAK